MLDIDDIADVVSSAVREATAPLIARLDVLEQRASVVPEKGDPGPEGPPGPPGEIDMEAMQTSLEAATAPLLSRIAALEEAKAPDVLASPEFAERLKEAAEAAVGTIPMPKDGAPGVPGDPGIPGNDGCGIKDLLIDRDGALIATFDDGRTKCLGPVVGADGKDGEKGADGFSLDDFDIEPLEDGRTIKLVFTRGELRHSYELQFPVMIYREVYQDDATYQPGDTVTWGGSLWVAQKETSAKPDGPDSGWRLAVKKGRDGKDKA